MWEEKPLGCLGEWPEHMLHTGELQGWIRDRHLCVCSGASRCMLTIWVHVVTGHLWGGEPLLERVCAVTILIHGNQLLLRRSQWCERVHHSLHSIGHHFCMARRAEEGEILLVGTSVDVAAHTMGAHRAGQHHEEAWTHRSISSLCFPIRACNFWQAYLNENLSATDRPNHLFT